MALEHHEDITPLTVLFRVQISMSVIQNSRGRALSLRAAMSGAALALAAAMALQPMPASAQEGVVKGDTSKKRIGFSNSYAGNSFRQVMVKSWQEVAEQARKDGLVAQAPVVSANNSV
ncbi:MAG TPA: hypothetical protein VLJ58_16525, partial [Ramlibacter sp.]|nr:hypothetical protein [Ramlibacter sp.]